MKDYQQKESSSGVKLIEKELVPSTWKALHIASLVGAALFGICAGVVLSLIYEQDVFLCGSASLRITSASVPGSYEVDNNGSFITFELLPSGAGSGPCEYSQYTMITSFIFATIWAVFFMMCGKGGKSNNGLPQPWRIVLPALLFSTIFFFLSLGAGAQTSMAINGFCRNFDQELARLRNDTEHIAEKCHDLDLFLKIVDNITIQSLIQLSEAMVWLCVTAWGCSTGLCLARMLTGPDFHPILLTTGEIDAPRATKGEGYKTLHSSPSASSVPSSPEPSKTPRVDFAIPGTSCAIVHAVPEDSPTESVPGTFSASKEVPQTMPEQSVSNQALVEASEETDSSLSEFHDLPHDENQNQNIENVSPEMKDVSIQTKSRPIRPRPGPSKPNVRGRGRGHSSRKS